MRGRRESLKRTPRNENEGEKIGKRRRVKEKKRKTNTNDYSACWQVVSHLGFDL